jgi:hypothetical protein
VPLPKTLSPLPEASPHRRGSFFSPTGTSFGPGSGIVSGTGCSQLGIVGNTAFRAFVSTLIPIYQAGGVISPTKFAVFLMNNVVLSRTDPPTVTACCVFGYHGATGSPAQTFGVMDWDTTGVLGGGAVIDAAGASHEIGEWMNDPLGTNPTPTWGNIGQISGCRSTFEVGDPLTGTNMPVITLNGYDYHLQELAFISWFYGTVPFSAGGTFSSNGTFGGPAQPCPPGGTF